MVSHIRKQKQVLVQTLLKEMITKGKSGVNQIGIETAENFIFQP